MISKDIIKLASNTSNVGLKNKSSYEASLKNSFCGDKITLELVANNQKIYKSGERKLVYGLSLKDVLIFQNWIDFAKIEGDDSCKVLAEFYD